MTFNITCPECKKTLKSSKPIAAGKIITCPKCSVMFPAPAVKAKPVPVPAGVDVVEEDDEFGDVEIIEDPPKKKEAPKPAPKVPSGDQPRKKRKKKSSAGLIIGLSAGLVCFAAFIVGAILGVRWLLAENNDPVAYLPPKPVVLGSIDISRMMDSTFGPSLEALINSGEFAAYCQDAGVSPKSAIDRMAFGIAQSRPGVFSTYGLVMVGKSGFDKQKFAKAFGAKATTFGGRNVFQSGSGAAAQTMIFTSKLVADIGGPPSDAEDVIRTAGRNGPTTIVSDMLKRVSGGHAWLIFDPAVIPPDNPAMKGIPSGSRDALAACRCMGLEANLSGDILELKSYMLMQTAATAETMVAEAKKQPDSAGFGLTPVEPPTISAQDTMVTATVKFKAADIANTISTVTRMASMFGTQQPAGGGRGGGRR
jgi:hypothetical protein